MIEQNKIKPEIKVLIIDDDRKLCRLISDYLEPMGFKLDSVHTGMDGLNMAEKESYEAIILDVMMPGMDGFEVLKELRKKSNIPVLMLTAMGDETDRIVGLEMGADDYLPKTFSSRELLARLRAVIRRANIYADKKLDNSDGNILKFENLEINKDSRSVFLDGNKINLTPLEYDLLNRLIRSSGKVVTRDQLLDSVVGRDYEVFDRSIDVHISSIRRKLGEAPKSPRFIHTIRGAGYMFQSSEDKS